MRVRLAKSAGFCKGVRRAMNSTLRLAARTRRPIFTYGPLIHNPQVVELLEKRHIHATDDVARAKDGMLLIRSHGIAPQVRQDIKDAAVEFHDLTCPDVANIQGIIKKHAAQGFDIVIVGDRDHAETVGLFGFAGVRGHVVSSPDEVKCLNHLGKVCVVAQSTQDAQVFEEVVRRIQELSPDAKVINTICDSTRERQQEVARLAREVNAMVIVGGRNSANTARLAEISRKSGTPTYHIETQKDIDQEEMAKYDVVGVTAGASTPNWIILEVVDSLRQIRKKGALAPAAVLSGIADFIVKTNLFLAVGGTSVTALSMRLQGVDFTTSLLPLLAFCYIFSAHTLNQLVEIDEYQIKHPARLRFLRKWSTPLRVACAIGLVTCLAFVLTLRIMAGAAVLALLALGLLYHIRIVPRPLARAIRYERLRDIPGSKDFSTSLAWATVAALLPFLNAPERQFSMAMVLSFLYVGGLVFIRSLLLDVMDVEGDRMVGRETLPVLLGKEGTKVILGILALLIAGAVLLSILMRWIPPEGYLLFLPIAYTCGYLFLYHVRLIEYGLATDIVVDGVFLSCGAIALLL